MIDNIKRIEILKQRLNRDIITELEQDELFELLDLEGKLDSWLDEGVMVSPCKDVIYDDKEFLKSISKPIVVLKVDETIVYANKSSLYRRSINFLPIKVMRIVAAVAVMLLIPLAFQWFPKHNETTEYIVKLESDSLNGLFVNDTLHQSVEITVGTQTDKSTKKYLSKVELRVVEKEIPRLVISDTPINNPSLVAEVITATIANSAEIKTIVMNEEMTLYASAEQWDSESEEYSQDEFIVNNEEWKPSKTMPQRVLKRIKEHVNYTL